MDGVDGVDGIQGAWTWAWMGHVVRGLVRVEHARKQPMRGDNGETCPLLLA